MLCLVCGMFKKSGKHYVSFELFFEDIGILESLLLFAIRLNKSMLSFSADNNDKFDCSYLKDGLLPDFNPFTNSCRLCLMEKYIIMHRPDIATINQRDEFFTPCQHKQSKLLDNAIT